MGNYTSRDYIVTLFARILRDYCDDQTCENCPFAPGDIDEYKCRIATPAYWNLKEVNNEKTD